MDFGFRGWGHGFAWEQNGEKVDFDALGLAEEFEQDADAFFSREDFEDGSAHALEGAVRDFDFLTGFDLRLEGDAVLRAMVVEGDFLADAIYESIGDGGDLIAEADQAADAVAVGDGAFQIDAREACEDVAREERFDPPDFAPSGGFAVAEAGAEDLDSIDLAKVFGGEMFAASLGTDRVPERVEERVLRWDVLVHCPRSF